LIDDILFTTEKLLTKNFRIFPTIDSLHLEKMAEMLLRFIDIMAELDTVTASRVSGFEYYWIVLWIKNL